MKFDAHVDVHKKRIAASVDDTGGHQQNITIVVPLSTIFLPLSSPEKFFILQLQYGIGTTMPLTLLLTLTLNLTPALISALSPDPDLSPDPSQTLPMSKNCSVVMVVLPGSRI